MRLKASILCAVGVVCLCAGFYATRTGVQRLHVAPQVITDSHGNKLRSLFADLNPTRQQQAFYARYSARVLKIRSDFHAPRACGGSTPFAKTMLTRARLTLGRAVDAILGPSVVYAYPCPVGSIQSFDCMCNDGGEDDSTECMYLGPGCWDGTDSCLCPAATPCSGFKK